MQGLVGARTSNILCRVGSEPKFYEIVICDSHSEKLNKASHKQLRLVVNQCQININIYIYILSYTFLGAKSSGTKLRRGHAVRNESIQLGDYIYIKIISYICFKKNSIVDIEKFIETDLIITIFTSLIDLNIYPSSCD